METLLHECMTWILDQDTWPAALRQLRTSNHLLPQTTDFGRRQRPDRIIVLSYTKALKEIQRESVDMIIRKKRWFYVGAVVRQHDG